MFDVTILAVTVIFSVVLGYLLNKIETSPSNFLFMGIFVFLVILLISCVISFFDVWHYANGFVTINFDVLPIGHDYRVLSVALTTKNTVSYVCGEEGKSYTSVIVVSDLSVTPNWVRAVCYDGGSKLEVGKTYTLLRVVGLTEKLIFDPIPAESNVQNKDGISAWLGDPCAPIATPTVSGS